MSATVMVNPAVTWHVEVRSSRKSAESGDYVWVLDSTPHAQKIDAEHARMKANRISHKERRLVLFVNGVRIADFQRKSHRYAH